MTTNDGLVLSGGPTAKAIFNALHQFAFVGSAVQGVDPLVTFATPRRHIAASSRTTNLLKINRLLLVQSA